MQSPACRKRLEEFGAAGAWCPPVLLFLSPSVLVVVFSVVILGLDPRIHSTC